MNRLEPWLSLKSVSGIGSLLFQRLLDRFGSPENVLSASHAELLQIEGITPRLAQAILSQRTTRAILQEIDRTFQQGFSMITCQDPEYPPLLLQIPDPPPLLYVYGKLRPMPCPIAVVGSRKATSYGRTTTLRLAKELAERGATIVSGMARGIDTAAHQGALNTKGHTIAVLGSGLNRVYPLENFKLFHQIAEKGAVVTEFALDAEPTQQHFPMRNRIISGMCLGTVVVEAAQRSGSLITARLAAEQNREVFSVPGNINAPTARGTHDLIKQGAKLVENAEDIFCEIAPQLITAAPPLPARGQPLPMLSPEERLVFAAIGAYPVHIDELAHALKLEIARLTGYLTQLELKGVVGQEPGKRFFRHTAYREL